MNTPAFTRLLVTSGLLATLTACSDGVVTPRNGAPVMQRSANAPLIIAFAKEFQGLVGATMVWHGEVTLPDGSTSDLFSTIDLAEPGTREAGNTLHATVRWVITGSMSFEVETHGVINLRTGIVRTNGRVVAGEWAGARAHQQGQLDGLDASGFIRIQ
jgi:hypothetical protein